MSGEFGGIPLIVGAARGVRAFDVDALGRLTGVTHKQVWTPNENKSECLAGKASGGRILKIPASAVSSLQVNSGSSSLSFLRSYTDVEIELNVENVNDISTTQAEPVEHTIEGCTCGFYAYYSGENDYATTGRIQAVVDGYGETTIGTRGFRADKANIVALCIPKDSVTSESSPPKLIRWFHRHEDAGALVAGIGGMFALLLAIVSFAGLSESPWSLLGLLLSLALFALVQRGYAADFGSKWGIGSTYQRQRDYPSLYGDPHPKSSAFDALVAKVGANYDVPVFETYEAMVKAYPPDHGTIPTPETDPDFWTRGIA